MNRPRPGVAFSIPWFDEAERTRVLEALGGRIAGDGPFCRRVEERLARLLGARRVLLTTSCTHALELPLLALGIGHGHEAICPSFTFVSTAHALLRLRARPALPHIRDPSLAPYSPALER